MKPMTRIGISEYKRLKRELSLTPAKGYIFSRSFFGQRVPQRVQNIVVRDFAAQKQFNVSFSSVEYCHIGSTAILESLLDATLLGKL